MLPERRRLLIGLALVVVLGGAAWSYLGGGTAPAGTPVERGTTRRPTQSSTAAEPLPPAEEVRLASLKTERDEPADTTRNPFKFGRRPAAAEAPPETTPTFTPATAAPAAPSGPPPPPPIPLKFIGLVEKGSDAKWAVLSIGDGRSPLHGKEGDIIDGRYRILKIGTESIDMVYLDGRGRQTIRLTGQ
jgi:hypothetical protein